jgi:hypothetical protein
MASLETHFVLLLPLLLATIFHAFQIVLLVEVAAFDVPAEDQLSLIFFQIQQLNMHMD